VSTSLPEYLRGLVDDAAIFPPGNAPIDVALRANRTRAAGVELVGAFVVDDRRIPDLDRAVSAAAADGVPGLDAPLPVSVVVTGGAGALDSAARWATSGSLGLAGLEIALRDSATGELGHNARRIVIAVDSLRASALLDDDVPVYVEMPRLYGAPPTPDWFGALDELAAQDLRLKLRTGGEDADAFPSPHELAGSIEAALDREMTFKCTAGLHRAVRHHDEAIGTDQHGFLNVLLATRSLFDGASVDEAAAVLVETDATSLASRLDAQAMTSTRRWFRSFGSCSIDEPLEDLRVLGLVDA
jgi:hypothetical protein